MKEKDGCTPPQNALWFASNAITKFNMDAMTAKPFHVEITGELRDTETVMCSSEGGDWKSAITVTRWSPTLLLVRFFGGSGSPLGMGLGKT